MLTISQIHWYERMFPLGANGTIDHASIKDNNTYYTNEGVSMTHIVNGAAGNIESHSTLPANETLPITNVLNQKIYGTIDKAVSHRACETFADFSVLQVLASSTSRAPPRPPGHGSKAPTATLVTRSR